MFCRSRLAGYLRGGSGILTAGGKGEMVEKEEEVGGGEGGVHVPGGR